MTSDTSSAVASCGGTNVPDVAAYQELGSDLFTAVENHNAASATPDDSPRGRVRRPLD